MESFQTAPLIRFYGADATAEAVEPELEDTPAEAAPAAPVAHLRLAAPPPSRGPGLIAAVAALAGVAAVALATWAFVSVVRAVDEDRRPAAPPAPTPTVARTPPVARKPNRALSLLALRTTERYRVAGSVGRMTLAVVPGDRGFLILNGLWRAPKGKVYVAWLVPPAGTTIRSVATFRGGTGLVPLRRRVREGAAVAVTLEHSARSAGPSRTPRLVAVRRP